MPSRSEQQFSLLSSEEHAAALRLARRAVSDAVRYRKLPESMPAAGVFGLPRGVFVTLYVSGRLHGCIGVIEPHEPLGEAIVRCAASAALEDPRFPAMREEDLLRLTIEISLLSVPHQIDPAAVEIGRHGLIVARTGKRGLLLPQVAVEHHLSREQFLDETCRKAGLPRDAWRDSATEISAFTCEVFGDPAGSAASDS
jgi:AmmeMemoRadiSam system protein A